MRFALFLPNLWALFLFLFTAPNLEAVRRSPQVPPGLRGRAAAWGREQ